MDIKEISTQLQIQADIGRTKFGRDLGTGMVELVQSSINALNDESSEIKQIGDCSGCGFMSLSDGFANGCPNCGCKDFKFVDVT
jgi:rubrerythrin